MARTKISEFSATAADNTDIDSIDIAEGCAPSGINNAIRELMAQLKDFQTGAAGDPFNGAVNGTLGATTPAAATVTTFSYSGTLTGGTGVVNIGSGEIYKNAGGFVGFGTTSPISKVSAVYDTSNPSDFSGFVSSTNSNFTSGSHTGFLMKTGDSLNSYIASIRQGSSAGVLAFGVNNGSSTASLQEAARFDSSLNLLVGSTSNTVSNHRQYIVGTNNVLGINASSGGTAENIRFYNAGTAVGTVQTTATATIYNTSSDYRLKENIQPMMGALAKVALLKPCTYTWKSDGSVGQGFIAHELQAVVPDCVSGQKDDVDENGNPKYQGIDTSFLVATLTAALQELKAEFDAYKASHS